MGYEQEPKKPSEEEKESYPFLQETIKAEPWSLKKMFKKAGKIAAGGLVFGLTACVGFTVVYPWMSDRFKSNPKEVTIPKDEEKLEDTQDPAKEEGTSAVTLEHYKEMHKVLCQCASAAGKGIVTLQTMNWDETSEGGQVSGAVMADNGNELLLISDNSIATTEEPVLVSFSDGEFYPVSLKKQNGNLGIAVYGVEKSILKDSTMNNTSVLKLGNSNAVEKGDPVIAIGCCMGNSDGAGYGVISSIKGTKTEADGEYGLLTTDIAGSEGQTGFLVNLDGEIIGITLKDMNGTGNLISAYAISGLKSEIEFLSNGKSVPYIGIIPAEVPEETRETTTIPDGIYVKRVEEDSPAMRAGIQSGDILSEVDGRALTYIGIYHNILMEKEKGDTVDIIVKRSGNGGYEDLSFKVEIGSKE